MAARQGHQVGCFLCLWWFCEISEPWLSCRKPGEQEYQERGAALCKGLYGPAF
jgi:hypothetical protein